MRLFVLAAVVVVATGTLAACGSTSGGAAPSGSGAGGALTVTVSDGACDVSTATLTAGTVEVTATSKAGSEAEVYLYAQENGAYTKILGEVEGLSNGLSKSFTATVPAGSYEVKCESGGKEIRVPVTAA